MANILRQKGKGSSLKQTHSRFISHIFLFSTDADEEITIEVIEEECVLEFPQIFRNLPYVINRWDEEIRRHAEIQKL